MIKILYLHTGAELYGADNVLLNILKNIDREKFCPYVVLPNYGPLVEELEKLKINYEIIEYPILRRKYFNFKGIIQYIRDYKKSCLKIIKYISDKNINLIHVNTIAVLEGIYISKKTKLKIIWHVHEILKKPKIVYYMTSFFIGKYASKIIVVSNAVKEHLLKSKMISKDKIITIYNGVNNKIFNEKNEYDYLLNEFNIPKNSFVIGMIGRINAIKGQDEFLKIVNPLIKKYPNIHAVLLGGTFEGQEWRLDKLKKEIANMKNADKIHLINFRKDVQNFHSLFDVLVLPSISPDSLPTVVLEAMASKKVVVGYKNGGIVEMIEEGESGFLAEIFDYTTLEKSIEMLYKDKNLYDKLSQNALNRQKSMFSNKSFIDSIEECYLDNMKGK